MKECIYINLLLLAAIVFSGCGKQDRLLSEGKVQSHRMLEISFVLATCRDIQPSYQTAIWLEKEDGTYFKSLLVSEYLSLGGYRRGGICSAWPGKDRWGEVSQDELDAVTAATPALGKHVLKFACPDQVVPNGKYRYTVEVHIVENYNVVCSGIIQISDGPDESIATVTYVPEKAPKGCQAVRLAAARYYP
jgi:hypothetical protein